MNLQTLPIECMSVIFLVLTVLRVTKLHGINVTKVLTVTPMLSHVMSVTAIMMKTSADLGVNLHPHGTKLAEVLVLMQVIVDLPTVRRAPVMTPGTKA